MKKPTKSIITSTLLAIAFGALSVGTTFALFTSEAETTIDVGAGTVNLSRSIALTHYQSSVDGKDLDISDNSYTNPDVGSSFSINAQGEVVISRMVPGDKLTLEVTATNKSNVITKVRYKVGHATVAGKDDLYPALELGFAKDDSSEGVADLFKWQTKRARNESTEPDGYALEKMTVTITFPDQDNGQILFGSANKDNQYQDAACSLVFSLQAVQGNAATNPIDEINAYLQYKAMTVEGQNPTMHDAMNDANELTYDLSDIPEGYVYDLANDQFVPESTVGSRPHHEFFKIYNNVPDPLDYSIYAGSDWNTANVEIDGVGFDAGNATVASVSYKNTTGNARSNIIRTNSLDTDVEIDAASDVVKHYGDARHVNIIAVAGQSYHEFGRVAFFEVANGRVALESGANVTQMHFAYDTENEKFNNIVIAYEEDVVLPEFSRDAVETIAEGGTLVVELQNSTDAEKADSDFIWLYQQGLMQQMRVSDNSESAGEVKATDDAVNNDTKQVAENIANSIKADVEQTYTPAQIDSGEVNLTDVVEQGIASEDREAVVNEMIENIITKDALSQSDNFVARIGSAYFTSFTAAFNAAKSGDMIRVIRNCSAPDQYDASGKTLEIYVEDTVTLSCGSVTNYKFIIGNGAAATNLTIDGRGKLTFLGNANYDLIQEMNSGANIKATVGGAEFEALSLAGTISSGKLTVKDGYYKNITFKSGTTLEAGYFTVDPSNGAAKIADATDGLEQCVKSSSLDGYPYVIGLLDEENATFKLTKANNTVVYFRSTYKASSSAGEGDLLEVIKSGLTFEVGNGFHSNHYFYFDANDVTLDLHGNKIKPESFDQYRYAVNIADGVTKLTIKNGVIEDAYGLCDSDSNNFTIVADNLTIDNCPDAMEHLTGFIYVQEQNDSYVLYPNTATESVPTTYKAKLDSTNDYYFNCDHSVAEAIKLAVNGSTVWANVNESTKATAQSLMLGDKITVIRADSSIDFPDFSGGEGKAQKDEIDTYTAEYTIVETYYFEVSRTGYLKSYKASEFNDAISDFLTHSDSTFDLLEDYESTATASFSYSIVLANMTMNLNGHSLSFPENSTSVFKPSTTNKTITITINGGDGGSLSSPATFFRNNNYNGSYFYVTFDGGYYQTEKHFVECNKQASGNKSSCTFESGTFVSSYGDGGIYNPTTTVAYTVYSGVILPDKAFNQLSGITRSGDKSNIAGVDCYQVA